MDEFGHGFGENGSAGGPAGFLPGSAGSATSLVELSMIGKNLRDMDVMSKSDPMCVVYIQPFGSNAWQEVLRTECIQNNLNPQFTRKVQISYCFEQQQNLKFDMFDIDNPSSNLRDHDFIGSATCTLGQIVTAGGGGSGGHGITLTLNNPNFNNTSSLNSFDNFSKVVASKTCYQYHYKYLFSFFKMYKFDYMSYPKETVWSRKYMYTFVYMFCVNNLLIIP